MRYCSILELKDAAGRVTSSGWICGRPQVRPCRWCRRTHAWLCDFKLPSGKDCDAPLCDHHTTKAGALDYCPSHKDAGTTQKGLFE
jgi:hypothetical protein